MNEDARQLLLPWHITLVAFTLGITSMTVQVVFLREFLSIFHGNELVLGVVLANWMVLTACGAFFGLRFRNDGRSSVVLVLGLLLLGVFPILLASALRLLKSIVFPAGTMVGLGSVLWYSLLILLPYCLIAGSLFTFLSATAARQSRPNAIANLYGVEAIGSLAGGLIFSLLLAFVLNSFQVLTATCAMNMAAVLVLVRESIASKRVVWAIAAIVLLPLLLMNFDLMTKSFLFPGQEVVFSTDSPYGTVTLTKQSDQLNYFENGVLTASIPDPAGSEEPVHFAMVQREAPTSVLMISGAFSGALQEVLKYDVKQLVYVEMNPQTLQAARHLGNRLPEDPRVRTICEDPRQFMRHSSAFFEVILLNVPEPATIQSNRFYTAESFKLVKEKLAAGGVLSIGFQSSAEYQSDATRQIFSSIIRTLRLQFKLVLPVPGQRTFLLASDSSLDIRIGHLVAKRQIPTTVVNSSYLDDRELQRRSELLIASVNGEAEVNKDFTPVTYFAHMVQWLSYFRAHLWVVILLAVALLAVAGRHLNIVTSGILTGGFAASSVELLLLVAFQTIFGYVYQMLGIIITAFMAGLAFGSLKREVLFSVASRRSYAVVQLLLSLLTLALAWFLSQLDSSAGGSPFLFIVFLILMFAAAALVGFEFSLAAALRLGGASAVASELYALDLVGSALGSLLVASILIPAVGFVGVSLIAGTLTFVTGLAALLMKSASSSGG